jgi:hypothetical protein
MHDEGTGGNANGGYGFFPLFPLTNCTFAACPVGIGARAALRKAGADGASLLPFPSSSNLPRVLRVPHLLTYAYPTQRRSRGTSRRPS